MELTPYEQTMAFLWSFVLGAVVAVVYIVFEMIRALSPPSKIQLFCSDVLFMVIVAMMNFLFAVSMTNGKIRMFTLMAEIGAFAVIYGTVGRILVRCSAVIRKIFLKIGRAVTRPWVGLAKRIRKFWVGKWKKTQQKEKI